MERSANDLQFLLLLFLLSGQERQPQQVLLWKFSPGQEFFVEENHRQLYQFKVGNDRVTSYLDYSLLQRYQVKSVQAPVVMLEATLERVRINNPNEAGKEAIEVLKKLEGAKQKWRLRKKEQVWQIEEQAGQAKSGAIFSSFLFTLGTSAYDPAQPTWQQSWQMPVADLGQAKLLMKFQAKAMENPQRLRVEVRPEFQWVAGEKSTTTVQVQDTPSSTPGLAFFDISRGRWDYLDFRVIATFQARQGERVVEVKQDFSAVYRVSDNRPFWP